MEYTTQHSSWTALSIICPEIWVNNYQTTVHSIPDERMSVSERCCLIAGLFSYPALLRFNVRTVRGQNPVCILWLIVLGKGRWMYRGLNNNSSLLLQPQGLHFLRSIFMKSNRNKEGCALTAATSALPWVHFPRRVAFWENSFFVKRGNSFKLCDWSCTPECAPWSSGEPESTGSAQRCSVIRGKQGYPEASMKNIHCSLLNKKCSPMCLLFIRATYAEVLFSQFIWSLMGWWPILFKAVDYIKEIICPPREFGKG